MPLILWSLGLVLGLLIFLTHLPLNAPLFNQLTVYACEPLPQLPSLGNRQSYPLNLRCMAGDRAIYQRTNTIPYSYRATTIPCRNQIGPAKIWRMAPPSPYGSYVFQATCGDLMMTSYKLRAANYESTQRFVIVIGALILVGTGIGLGVSLLRLPQRLRASDA